ncbi:MULTISPECIES: hypothetical protein [unclassified Wolbachia]|uniref:hypothetical protein n=2 Tax=Wolbachia TaxID=953 RepID=UPI00222784BD|nr:MULTISPECIES: hypothetical protein [unclassified Wolbachia]
MPNINNTANYEINVKRKEKKYSWSTVFAWLFLKTIGRILPKRWNRWAENILYYDKTTANNEVQTDAFKTIDGSVQVDLKPEVAVRESQSGVISKDGEVQTNKVTFHDIAMQTEYVETTDKNSDQAQQVEDLQSKNGLLEVKIEELRSIIIRLKADLQSKNSSLIGKNMGKELRDDTLKAKLSPSVRKCVKKLEFNKQEGVNKIVDSILHSFNSKNNNNNDSGELLKEIVTGKLTEAKMKCFSNKIQELQLALSIRDKFLSPDQGMCNQTQGGVNEYQLTEKAKKEYTPNSSMSHTNIASIHSLNSRKAVRIGP